MSKTTAQFLGAIAGAAVAVGWLLWSRMAPRACTGGVFMEFRPPLLQPGPYRFAVALDDEPPHCNFDVALPAGRPVNIARCGWPLELQTRGMALDSGIVGLTVGASPKILHLKISRGEESIYDCQLQPEYAAEPTPRSESKRFCGPRARVTPQCIRGASQCSPFPANCAGPEDCPEGKICCVSPESGREFGYKSASQCRTKSYCIGRLAHIACHIDDDCPSGMTCSDSSFGNEFRPALRGCRDKRQSN